MTGGFSVELPCIQPRISELSWLVHSSHEWAETVEMTARAAAVNEYLMFACGFAIEGKGETAEFGEREG
jgi:hypothetical protein